MTCVCLVADPRSLTDTFAAYFGPLSCVSWSPDSRFVAVGGQDDLVSIFSPRESRLVARCQGHSAFVTHIAFDPARGGGGGGYRFGSVGEDGKLLLVSGTGRDETMAITAITTIIAPSLVLAISHSFW
jgi:WD40 repeat protein